MKQIIINSEELQTRVAVVHDGVLHDFFMERKASDRMVGSIYKAKIKNLEPSLQAAFVDIGFGKNAFLHYWDMIPATQEMFEDDDADEVDDEDELAPVATPTPAPVTKAPEAPKPPQGKGFFARLYRMLFEPTPEEKPTAPNPPQRNGRRQGNGQNGQQNRQQNGQPRKITNSRSLLKLVSIESVMPSSHLILCHPLLLLPPIPPSIRVFSNESKLFA